MKNNLVTSYIYEAFDDKCKNILLGEWCNPNIHNQDLKINFETSEYFLNNNTNLIKGHKYLYTLFYKVLKNLTIHMNDFHKENKSERYWHIVLGSWLMHQMSILWDRWECLNKTYNDFDINMTRCLKYNLNELIGSDINDCLFNYAFGHRWNHILCSEIIKFNYSSKTKINLIYEESSKVKKNYTLNSNKEKKFYSKLIDFLLKNIFRNPKIVFYNAYFSSINKIFLPLSLGQMPRIYNEFEKKIRMPSPNNRENLKLSFETENNFEKFVKEILFKLMPVSYLEGYKKILFETKKIKYSPKLILTSTGHLSNDMFQIWTAEKVFNGVKFLISEHGGTWEKDEYFENYKNTADFFLSWNKDNDKKAIQVPININLKKKNILKKNDKKKILLILGTELLYNVRLRHPPICSQILEDYDLWKKFVNNLSPDLKDSILIRPHVSHDSWNLIKKLNNDFGNKYISKNNSFEKDVNKSRIIVDTAIQTTTYEVMKTGIPIIILFNRSILNMDQKISKLFDIFVENKIIFRNSYEAAAHIKNISSNPLEWWNSKKMLDIRELFTEYCSMESKSNFTYWKNFLKSQIDNKL